MKSSATMRNRRARSSSTRPRAESYASDKERASHRSASLDRRSSRSRNDSDAERGRRRNRSNSRDRYVSRTGGVWAYIPPTPTFLRPPSPVIVDSPPVYTVPAHRSMFSPSPNISYCSQPGTPARIYLRTGAHLAESTPSKPRASVFISPKSSSESRFRKANVYVLSDNDDEVSLRK